VRKQKGARHGKKAKLLERRIEKLFNQLPVRITAIYDAELAQLKLIAPAPGDETLVSDWLANRQQIQDLTRQANALEKRANRLFDRAFTKHSFQAYKKLTRKVDRLERQVNQIYRQVEPLTNKDVEIGTQLGATYCVTDATGPPAVA
jgi:hypothetical protein